MEAKDTRTPYEVYLDLYELDYQTMSDGTKIVMGEDGLHEVDGPGTFSTAMEVFSTDEANAMLDRIIKVAEANSHPILWRAGFRQRINSLDLDRYYQGNKDNDAMVAEVVSLASRGALTRPVIDKYVAKYNALWEFADADYSQAIKLTKDLRKALRRAQRSGFGVTEIEL